jgi:thiol-disulfide isomerase/thioredoxin
MLQSPFGDRFELRGKIEPVAQLYAEKFANNNKGKRLAEYIEASKVKVGNKYIDFEAPDMKGDMFRFSQMIKGSRIVVLDLWASWCGPCRVQAMKNIPIYEKYKDKGMCVVSVARERDNLVGLEKAVAKDGYKWPVLVELDDRINLWRQYNAGDSGGSIYIIDPTTKKILAINPTTEEIEALVEQYCK